MLNLCDECKHQGLTVDYVENGEPNEDDSDSDSETNMVRCYQWKRDDDGYLTKLMVEVLSKWKIANHNYHRRE